ncbi:anthranilate phosphoribosyltransferase [Halobacteriales archaeon QH_10_67_22]|nr:MAG: anthranilate phosphoribosyltransferase [Halobacteriales archaeon QH_10_67_22]
MAQATQEYGDWPLKRLMTEVVGSGHKSAADMDRDQAREAMQRILDGEPDHTTLGAFWLANRWKRNTPEELAGFVDVMREESVETATPAADPVDCGANYDGKGRSAILGVAAGVVAAAAGTPVVVHSGDRVPTQKQDAYKHVLDELGVRTDLNTMETLANPANADVHLGSFYHLAFAVRMVDTLRACESQSVERALFFQGMEGYDDIRPGTTVVAEWSAGDEDVSDFEIETGEYGMDFESEDLGVDDVADESAAITEAVVRGERDDQFADAVALNAALRMYAREDVDTLDEGLERARTTIENGDAAATLEALQAF